MTTTDIKSSVGAHIYGQACNEARSSAAGTGSLDSWHKRSATPALDTVLLEIGFDACAGQADSAFVSFFTGLYREMPTYALLHRMFIIRSYAELDTEARRSFWSFAREMLSSADDALADPVAYQMWCDFFETASATEAWKALTPDASDRLLERILIMSGPVPFPLKRDLFEQKIGSKRWHYFIYRSLLHSTFDVYGKIERKAARLMLGRLKLSLPKDEQRNLELLRAKLSSDQ